MQGDECLVCPEGKTSARPGPGNNWRGATSEGQCDSFCGLPPSTDAGDNAHALVPALNDVSQADLALRTALIPYVKLVQDEKDQEAPLQNAKKALESAKSAVRAAEQIATSKNNAVTSAKAVLAQAQKRLADSDDDTKEAAQAKVDSAQAALSAAEAAAAVAAGTLAGKKSSQAGTEADVAGIEAIIEDLQAKQKAQAAVYNAKYAARLATLQTAAPLLAVDTEEETDKHFKSAKNRCQPDLLCIPWQPAQRWSPARYYPKPCEPWPQCSKLLPSGGYENGQLKPLTAGGRAVDGVAKTLKSYDGAAGYDADPAIPYAGGQVERGSTGPSAFFDEFDQ